MLLAAAVPAAPGDSALELGCGAGAAILCLGARVPRLRLAGLELQPAYAALAQANADRNGIALAVHQGDVAAAPVALRALTVDHVLMNPPYFDRRRTTRARDAGRDAAHGEGAPLAAWGTLAARRLRPGGTLSVIQRIARLADLLAALPPSLGSVEVLPLAARAGEAPHSLVLRARKGGRAEFRLLAPLALHDGDGFAPAVRQALREGAPLPWD